MVTSAQANQLQILYEKVGCLRPYENNPRTHTARQIRTLRRNIERHGMLLPILVTENRVIVDGHAVLEAAKQEGFDEVPVLIVQHRSEADIRAIRLAMNRIAQDAGWDDPKLRRELEELIAVNFDMDLTGFPPVEIDARLEIDLPSSGETEEEFLDDVEPQGGLSTVKQGEVWQLGEHTVICGDATSPDTLKTALGNRLAQAVFSDPPYNLTISGFVSGLGKTKHHEFSMASGEMSRLVFTQFLSTSIAAMLPGLKDGAIIFVCMDWRHLSELTSAAEANGLEPKNLVVWVKTNAGMGTFYRSRHELIAVYKKPGASHQNNFELGQHGRSRSNVWNYAGVNTFSKDRQELLSSHPTCKPVLMVADAIRDVTRRRDVVLDPFLGSGSTLLAAEQTGRICVGAEIDPRYVDVIVRRWQKRTKRDARNALSGESFDDASVRQEASGAKKPKADHP